MNENEIRDALMAGIGEEPAIVGGPDAVFAGARTRTVRTRTVTGALSVVAVLGVTAGAVALGGGSAGGGKPQVTAGAAAAVTSGVAAAGPQELSTGVHTSSESGALGSHTTVAPKPGAGQVLLDGRSATELLKQALPSGLKTANYYGQDSYTPEELGVSTSGEMSIDDGTGKLNAVS